MSLLRFALSPLLLATTPLQPLAAQASQPDFDLPGVNRYASSDGQVTSMGQFADVKPTDWAYQALSNLIGRYGCVAGYPNGTFKGGRAISRFEAAALLNACLDLVTETTDQLKKLLTEFQKELAILKGRVDGLDTKVGKLEAIQFSTTTKLSGQATFVVGGVGYSGSAYNAAANTVRRRTGSPVTGVNENVTFNYDLQINLDTSFTGKDLLRTNLRAGNFGNSAFGGAPHGLGNSAELEVAFEEDSGADNVGLYKLFYQFPIGKQLTATVGARVGQEDMLALWPSVYPADTILNLFTVNGAPAAYSKNLGAGAGLWWQNNGWSVSANYVAARGSDSTNGLFTSESGATASVQIGYQQEQWGLAAIWSYVQPLTQYVPGTTPTVHSSIDHGEKDGAETNAFGLSGFWQPLNSGWVPSVSLGWGINTTSYSVATTGRPSVSQSWMVGLQWTDVLAQGNDFGLAIGQAVFATALTGGVSADDGNYALEGWYKFQVTDAISITPALFYLSRPLGQRTPEGQSFSSLGALVKTTFKF
jgi:hypothetical protein